MRELPSRSKAKKQKSVKFIRQHGDMHRSHLHTSTHNLSTVTSTKLAAAVLGLGLLLVACPQPEKPKPEEPKLVDQSLTIAGEIKPWEGPITKATYVRPINDVILEPEKLAEYSKAKLDAKGKFNFPLPNRSQLKKDYEFMGILSSLGLEKDSCPSLKTNVSDNLKIVPVNEFVSNNEISIVKFDKSENTYLQWWFVDANENNVRMNISAEGCSVLGFNTKLSGEFKRGWNVVALKTAKEKQTDTVLTNFYSVVSMPAQNVTFTPKDKISDQSLQNLDLLLRPWRALSSDK